MQEEKPKKRFSIFQITCMVLTVILIVVIIIQVGILINLKIKTDKLKDKNDEIVAEFLKENECFDEFLIINQ